MGRQLNIFLVEDNQLDAMVFQRIMKKVDPGVEVYHALDGAEALQSISSPLPGKALSQPYLTLLDVNMPGMNGHELLAKLRSQPADQHAIVFMFTTSSSSSDISKAYEAGANGYIVKPESADEMVSVLQCLRDFWNICEPPFSEAGQIGAV